MISIGGKNSKRRYRCNEKCSIFAHKKFIKKGTNGLAAYVPFFIDFKFIGVTQFVPRKLFNIFSQDSNSGVRLNGRFSFDVLKKRTTNRDECKLSEARHMVLLSLAPELSSGTLHTLNDIGQ